MATENDETAAGDELAAILELREHPQWVRWRRETRDGKTTKVPYTASGSRAESDNPKTWARYEDVVENGAGSDGIGFVVSEDDDYCGIDLDDCVENGLLHPEAAAMVARLDSYTEFSPSGNGVRVFVRGRHPGTRFRTKKTPWGGNIEIYDNRRFFTVTGEHVRGCPQTIEERQEALEEVYERAFGKGTPSTPAPVVASSNGDELERAFAAKNGEKLRRLFNGDTSAYDSDSEATLALCGMLAFWTGPDPGKLDSLFRRSALMRDKWDSRRGDSTWGEQTIATALDGRTEFYEPRENESFISFPAPIEIGAAGNESNGGSQKAPVFQPVPLESLLSNVPPEPAWTLRGYIAPFALTLLAGRPKVGKSTTVFALLACLVSGEPFAGVATSPAGVLVLTEERRDTLAEKARVLGLVSFPAAGSPIAPEMSSRPVHVLMRQDAPRVAWPELVRHAMTYSHQHELGVLIVDTWDRWTNLRGDSENAAGAVNEALEPLQYAAASGLAVVIVTHQRKSLGEFGEAVRGSNALTGGVDVVVELERAPASLKLSSHARVLRAVSRFSSTPEELYLELDEHASVFLLIESPEEAKAAAEREQTLETLAAIGGGMTSKELAEKVELTDRSVRRYLAEFLDSGHVTRTGAGKRNDPYRWHAEGDE